VKVDDQNNDALRRSRSAKILLRIFWNSVAWGKSALPKVGMI